MQLPIVSPAPLVTVHAATFADLCENQCQFRHFQNYLTGPMVLPNKSLANIARCILDSADKTNLSRFFSEAQWFQDQVNDRRLRLPAGANDSSAPIGGGIGADPGRYLVRTRRQSL